MFVDSAFADAFTEGNADEAIDCESDEAFVGILDGALEGHEEGNKEEDECG